MKIRPIRIDGAVAYVPLTQGYEAVIDAVDVPLVDGRNWYVEVKANTCGLIFKTYARSEFVVNGLRCRIYMHRVISNFPPDVFCDHADCDGLNNKRSNLRAATKAQNQRNQRLSSINTSGFKGVTFLKQRGRWQAQIKVDGKKKFLGAFATPQEAHEAYSKASSELHGEFGRVA